MVSACCVLWTISEVVSSKVIVYTRSYLLLHHTTIYGRAINLMMARHYFRMHSLAMLGNSVSPWQPRCYGNTQQVPGHLGTRDADCRLAGLRSTAI